MNRCFRSIFFLAGLLIFANSAGAETIDDAMAAYHSGDYAGALKSLAPFAEQGDVQAEAALGYMYLTGSGVAEDDKEALKWNQKAADQGLAQGEYNLGNMYQTGRGIPRRNFAEAARLYRKAADQNYALAQLQLGILYETGAGVSQDYTEAMKWYRKAAGQGPGDAQKPGLVDAQTNIAHLLMITRDYEEAAKQYRIAAENGGDVAQGALAAMYFQGLGVEKNNEEGMKWCFKSAKQGNAVAQNELGAIYQTGRGVPADSKAAVYWFTQAAEQGLAMAEDNLGVLYGDGNGVEQDWVKSYMWIKLSADQGYTQAEKDLSYAGAHLAPAQIEEAKRLAAARPPVSPRVLWEQTAMQEFFDWKSLPGLIALLKSHGLPNPGFLIYLAAFLSLSLIARLRGNVTRVDDSRPAPDDAAMPGAIMAEIRNGNKIEAIKLWRGWTGMGLRDSKDIIEEMIRRPEAFKAENSFGRSTKKMTPDQMAKVARLIAEWKP